jgi:ferredoxin
MNKKTLIVYFTGTGNSLHAAREMTRRLGDCELIPAVKYLAMTDPAGSDRIGFVFPVYMYHIPHIMARCLERPIQATYTFVLAVNAGEPGIAISTAQKLLAHQGKRLDAGFSICSPSNYIPFGGAESDDKQKLIFSRAAGCLDAAAKVISNSGHHLDRDDPWYKTRLFPGLLYNQGYKYIRYLAKSFVADERCDGCGICAKVCPVGNIELKEKRPVWGQNCEQCFACLQWCPREAVQYGKKTRVARRYTNPFTELKDVLRRT